LLYEFQFCNFLNIWNPFPILQIFELLESIPATMIDRLLFEERKKLPGNLKLLQSRDHVNQEKLHYASMFLKTNPMFLLKI